jgi:hypothetical protein
MAAAQFYLEQADDGLVLRLVGNWTVTGLPEAERRSQGFSADAHTRPTRVDARELAALDTAGALMLIQRWLGRMPWPAIDGLRPADQDLTGTGRRAHGHAAGAHSNGASTASWPLAERAGALRRSSPGSQLMLLLAFGGQTLESPSAPSWSAARNCAGPAPCTTWSAPASTRCRSCAC